MGDAIRDEHYDRFFVYSVTALMLYTVPALAVLALPMIGVLAFLFAPLPEFGR